ncbi:MAG: zinc-binding alcohol dehydrogenase [Pseudomonadota bacterium]
MAPLALWYTAPGTAEIRPAHPGEGDLRVDARFSAISRGTERLICAGGVPQAEYQRMRAPFQEGAFPFPVKYGYAMVGEAQEGPPGLAGRHVFALHPHQTGFRLPSRAALPLPEGVPPSRAVLAANMETALNAIWDAPLIPGGRVAVIGAGVVGCLTAYLAAHVAGCHTTLVDKLARRQATSAELDVSFETLAAFRANPCEYDVIFHCSASEEGLRDGLSSLTFEGTLVEMSWFGDREIALPLGGAFHARRLRLISSQVGQVAPSRRATTTRRDRLAEALSLLTDPRLEALLTDEVRFEDLPSALPTLFGAEAPGIVTTVLYGA